MKKTISSLFLIAFFTLSCFAMQDSSGEKEDVFCSLDDSVIPSEEVLVVGPRARRLRACRPRVRCRQRIGLTSCTAISSIDYRLERLLPVISFPLEIREAIKLDYMEKCKNGQRKRESIEGYVNLLKQNAFAECARRKSLSVKEYIDQIREEALFQAKEAGDSSFDLQSSLSREAYEKLLFENLIKREAKRAGMTLQAFRIQMSLVADLQGLSPEEYIKQNEEKAIGERAVENTINLSLLYNIISKMIVRLLGKELPADVLDLIITDYLNSLGFRVHQQTVVEYVDMLKSRFNDNLQELLEFFVDQKFNELIPDGALASNTKIMLRKNYLGQRSFSSSDEECEEIEEYWKGIERECEDDVFGLQHAVEGHLSCCETGDDSR